jgi:cation:H+ antiporter
VGLLVLGSKWLTQGSVEIAQALGVSELVIGLTIVAGGTSLPELVTSILASFKGEREIAVGNVVGSNIFNVLCVLGLSALVSKAGISFSEAVFTIDLPVMLAISAACLPIFWVGRRVSRGDGLMFLCVYVVYTAFLILNAKGSPLAGQIGVIAFWGAIPLTLWAMGIKFIFPQSPPTPVGSVKD